MRMGSMVHTDVLSSTLSTCLCLLPSFPSPSGRGFNGGEGLFPGHIEPQMPRRGAPHAWASSPSGLSPMSFSAASFEEPSKESKTPQKLCQDHLGFSKTFPNIPKSPDANISGDSMAVIPAAPGLAPHEMWPERSEAPADTRQHQANPYC